MSRSLGRVDVFWADMRDGALTPSRFLPLLSRPERDRAARYRRDRDRDRFIVRRGLLRRLLSIYAGCPPEALHIATGEFGKPYLPGTQIGFSLSHSGDIALFAIGRGMSLGCDVERMDPRLASAAAAETVFSAEEMQAFLAVPATCTVECFYRIWTSLEARLKASGRGFLSGDAAAGGSAEHGRSCWFEPAPDYCACIALPCDPPLANRERSDPQQEIGDERRDDGRGRQPLRSRAAIAASPPQAIEMMVPRV